MLRSWGEMRVVVGGLSGDKISDTKYKWTWRSNWKPFYDGLTAKCYVEESQTESLFGRITS